MVPIEVADENQQGIKGGGLFFPSFLFGGLEREEERRIGSEKLGLDSFMRSELTVYSSSSCPNPDRTEP